MSSESWSDNENDLTVAAYFEMLSAELRREPYVKSLARDALVPLLKDRSAKAVEYKFQNISAVLLLVGEPWIDGYKPATRFQNSLIDAVLRWLDAHPLWTTQQLESIAKTAGRSGFRDESVLWIGPPPTFSNSPSPIEPTLVELVARKFDVAARDARNRALGEAGEELVLRHERNTLRAAGQDNLAARVRWVSREDGDGAGFDIASFESDGRSRLIEVKTTNGWERTPFHITRTEMAAADANRDNWHLVRLWDFARSPRAFSIRPPLDAHVQLTPTTFLASLH